MSGIQCNVGPLVYGKARTTSENNLFFVFTISSLVSLLLSRFYRSKKYVRDIYQPDWKIQPSVGPAVPSGPAVGPRHSMHVHEAVGARQNLGSPSGPHPSKYNEHARSASVQAAGPDGSSGPTDGCLFQSSRYIPPTYFLER